MRTGFRWSDLGDIKVGRPNLGGETKVMVYRLMHYSLRTVLENALGREQMERHFAGAGRLAGLEFCRNLLDPAQPLSSFLAQFQRILAELSVGILRVEKADAESLRLVVTVSEDLDCSGLPVDGEAVCSYDEGFISGVFEAYTGRPFVVKEVDCWATGERTCRFTIQPES